MNILNLQTKHQLPIGTQARYVCIKNTIANTFFCVTYSDSVIGMLITNSFKSMYDPSNNETEYFFTPLNLRQISVNA